MKLSKKQSALLVGALVVTGLAYWWWSSRNSHVLDPGNSKQLSSLFDQLNPGVSAG